MYKWNTQTDALKSAKAGLKTVDEILGFMSETVGQPTRGERALFAGAVVFAYGVWENYVEQLAVELVEHVSPDVEPEHIAELIKKKLEKKTAWELSVSPGWRHLWKAEVSKLALGDENSYGLNTAGSGQVKHLLENSGVVEPFKSVDNEIVPEHMAGSVNTPTEAIDALVTLRGKIVHTGNPPGTLRKKHVKEWREFVEELIKNVDKCSRQQCKELLAKGKL